MNTLELLQAIRARLDTPPYDPYDGDAYADLRKLLRVVELQQAALEFYARRESWHIAHSEVITPYSDIKCIMTCDLEQLSSADDSIHNKLGGMIARQALLACDKLAGEE